MWRHTKIFNSIITTADPDTSYDRGGFSLIVTNKWASRVVDHGSDPLGLWSWVKLKGKKDQHLYCLVMYRPNPDTVSGGNLLSTWIQQHRAILQPYLDQQNPHPTIDPQELCLLDLEIWIDEHIKIKNTKLIVLNDANQHLIENTRKLSLNQLVQKAKLTSVLHFLHGYTWLPSTKQGSKMIDQILTKNIDPSLIRQCGQPPYGDGFYSDHLSMFADLDANIILEI